MKVLVTGGAGFIGSHLTDLLVEEGYEVVVIDDLSTGKLANLSSSMKNITFIEASVLDGLALNKAMCGVDIVFHLAAIPSVPRSINNPVATHDSNAGGTLKVVLEASRNRVKRIVFSSSSSVYGANARVPTSESVALDPASPYAASKVAGEMYMRAFAAMGKIEPVILRFFNVYGPRQDPSNQYSAVVPRFISEMQAGVPSTIYGDGEQRRSFTYVRDVVSACVAAGRSDRTANGVFNISGNDSVSINDLYGAIMREVGVVGMEPISRPDRPGDIRNSGGITAAAYKAFGYRPFVLLEEGIKATVEWYKEGESDG